MITAITNFLLTQLIWSITGGSYHIPISFLLLFMLLKLWDHLSWIRAFFIDLYLTFGSFIIFFALIFGVIVWGLGTPYVLPEDTYQGSFDHLNMSLILAALYSGIQIVQLYCIRKWVHFNFWRTVLCAVCANFISALLVYKITFGT